MILSNGFSEALTYAAELHATQGSKDSGFSYSTHLLGTASIALEYGANEDEAISALLHSGDRRSRPPRHPRSHPPPMQGIPSSDATPKPPWRQRKQAYIDRISTASGSVRLVSAADKLYNVRSILKDSRQLGDFVWERFKGGALGDLWYYRSLVEAFRQAKSTPLVEELDRTLLE